MNTIIIINFCLTFFNISLAIYVLIKSNQKKRFFDSYERELYNYQQKLYSTKRVMNDIYEDDIKDHIDFDIKSFLDGMFYFLEKKHEYILENYQNKI